LAGAGVSSDLGLLMQLQEACTDLLFISIHTNSNEATSPHGTQVLYATDDSVKDDSARGITYYYGRDGVRNKALAEELYAAITAAVPQMQTSTSSTLADNCAVLRDNNLAAVLIEVGFISNQQDRFYLTDPASIAKIAQGIANGCVNFFRR
jgi:N-acetylmuramoyl-L-alanine amidase